MVSFSSEALNTTNGVETKYFFSWFSDIPAKDGDLIYIAIPIEMTMIPSSGNNMVCAPLNGIASLRCTKEANMLKIVLI
jgi:hypothetical protein